MDVSIFITQISFLFCGLSLTIQTQQSTMTHLSSNFDFFFCKKEMFLLEGKMKLEKRIETSILSLFYTLCLTLVLVIWVKNLTQLGYFDCKLKCLIRSTNVDFCGV